MELISEVVDLLEGGMTLFKQLGVLGLVFEESPPHILGKLARLEKQRENDEGNRAKNEHENRKCEENSDLKDMLDSKEMGFSN